MTLFQMVTDLLPRSAMVSTLHRRSQVRRVWWHLYEIVRPKGRFRVPVGNFRLWVDTSDSIIALSLIKHGIFEPQETEILKRLVSPGQVILDCGANLGYYSILAADVVGTAGRVHAFEPDPLNYDLLSANIAENEFSHVITAHGCALSDYDGEGTIFRDASNFGAHSLVMKNVDRPADSTRVSMRRLDSAIRERRIDLIKIDVQGAEPQLLKGAEGILRRDKPVLLLEWWPWGLRDNGGAKALSAFLESFGYVPELITAHGTERTDWQSILMRFPESDASLAPVFVCRSS